MEKILKLSKLETKYRSLPLISESYQNPKCKLARSMKISSAVSNSDDGRGRNGTAEIVERAFPIEKKIWSKSAWKSGFYRFLWRWIVVVVYGGQQKSNIDKASTKVSYKAPPYSFQWNPLVTARRMCRYYDERRENDTSVKQLCSTAPTCTHKDLSMPIKLINFYSFVLQLSMLSNISYTSTVSPLDMFGLMVSKLYEAQGSDIFVSLNAARLNDVIYLLGLRIFTENFGDKPEHLSISFWRYDIVFSSFMTNWFLVLEIFYLCQTQETKFKTVLSFKSFIVY